MSKNRLRGFTLLELIAVVVIIVLLVALLLPAIQSAREAARRNACANNVTQLMMAVSNYQSAHEMLPPGVTNPTGPIRNERVGMHHGWLIRLLPYLEESNAYRRVDFKVSVYAPENAEVAKLSPPVFRCPSHPGDVKGQSCYAGNQNDIESPIDETNHGLLFLNSQIRNVDILDGSAHTLVISEKQCGPEDLGWMSGTRSTLRNAGTLLNLTGPNDVANGSPPAASDVTILPSAAATESEKPKDEATPPESASPDGTASEAQSMPTGTRVVASQAIDPITYVGGFGSWHAGGIVNSAFGDGSVRGLAEDIDPLVLRRLANRADGQLQQVPE